MKIAKTECSYQVTECDLKFGEQITLDGELLIPVSVLNNIKSKIANLDNLNPTYLSDGKYTIDKTEVLRIIDKYKAESEIKHERIHH